MEGIFTFLGTSGAMGTPCIGCTCSTCTSDNTKDKRLRSSALIEYGSQKILIDPGPDFRQQALLHQISSLDGLMITHTHYDHIGGLDELRIYSFLQKKPLPCLLSSSSFHAIQKSFYYLFLPEKTNISATAQFDFHTISDSEGKFQFLGLPLKYTSYLQGNMPVLGFRLGSLAYITDIRTYPHTIFEFLSGVSTLVVSATRKHPTKLHFSLEEAIRFAEKSGVSQTYFTHLSHDFFHTTTQESLGDGMFLAYDGLKLPFYVS